MTADQLCGVDQCKIVHFMFHDRVSFGGSLIAIGTVVFVVNRISFATWGRVGVVVAISELPRRVCKFSGLPRLRLSRHVAWSGDVVAVALRRCWFSTVRIGL